MMGPTRSLGPYAVLWRLAVTAAVVATVCLGTWVGNDDWWPFAPMSQYAFSVVLNSPIQISLVLAPVLVLASQIFGLASFTLVFSPLLVVVLVLAIVLAAFIAFDGESTWLEGASLIALYAIIATSFWWG